MHFTHSSLLIDSYAYFVHLKCTLEFSLAGCGSHAPVSRRRPTQPIMSQDHLVTSLLLLLGLTCSIVTGRPDVGIHTQGILIIRF